MATLNVYQVQFIVVNLARGYVRPGSVRTATISASSKHPADLLAVLNADIPVLVGESIQITGVQELAGGTESAKVLS